jgi:hypothetical protein
MVNLWALAALLGLGMSLSCESDEVCEARQTHA